MCELPSPTKRSASTPRGDAERARVSSQELRSAGILSNSSDKPKGLKSFEWPRPVEKGRQKKEKRKRGKAKRGRSLVLILVINVGFFSRVLLTSHIRMASLEQLKLPPPGMTCKGSYQ